jgi:hypothetical protein
MRLLFLTLIIICHTVILNAQNCLHTNLSRVYDYKTNLQRLKRTETIFDSAIITVTIINKQTGKVIQTIRFVSGFVLADDFSDCSGVRSYITKENLKKETDEKSNDDLVIADLNFDGLEDIAVKYDSGGNSGSLYFFYLQNKNGQFEKDNFLTDEMQLFPAKTDLKNKQLTTYAFSSACYMGEHIYVFAAGKWKERSHRLIKVCKD